MHACFSLLNNVGSSVLPIGSNSLIYGSNDGGRTVMSSNPHFCGLMARAAQKLNLKGHVVGVNDQATLLYGPCDIEGHQGKDGRLYVLDTARGLFHSLKRQSLSETWIAVFPPEMPRPYVTGVLIPVDNLSSIITVDLSSRDYLVWTQRACVCVSLVTHLYRAT